MALKALNAIITVIAGIGIALALYWAMNKLAELLPGKVEERLKPYLYILPAFLAIVVYLLYPAVLTVLYSFKDSTSTEFVGFQNYQQLFKQHSFIDTLINTLLWMIIVPAVTVVFGLIVAVLADRLSPSAEKASKTVIFLPMAISAVGAATVWKFMFDYKLPGRPQIGLQNAIWTKLGNDPVDWLHTQDWHLNSLLLMVVVLWAQVGFSMVLLSAAIKGVPVETLEAARIDGANERQIFFRVVVPQIMGTIVTLMITVTIAVMKIFDIVYVMTNGGFNTNVLANEFFNQLTTNFNNGTAAAIVVMLMIAVIPIMWFQVRHFKSEEAA